MAESQRLPTQSELLSMLYKMQLGGRSTQDILSENLARGTTVNAIPNNLFQRMASGVGIAKDKVNKLGSAADLAKLFPGYTGQSQVNIPTGYNFAPKQAPTGEVMPQGLQKQQVNLNNLLQAITPGEVFLSGPERAYTDVGMGKAPNLLDVIDIAGLGAVALSPVAAATKLPIINNSLKKLIQENGIMGNVLEGYSSSKNPQIFDPKPTTQRPFYDDYPKGTGGPDGSRIEFDIEGRPLSARYIAGRNLGGGMDEGLTGVDTNWIAGGIGSPTTLVLRSGPELKGDAGRFIRGENRRIYIDERLSPENSARVMAHEVAHSIDDLVYGGKIPTTGLKKELSRVYEDLNTAGWFKPGRGMTPSGQGYKGADVDLELMAEAIRAYMRDPNYIKTVAPNTAKRIREYVNSNQNLNKIIQFNSIGAGAAIGADNYINDKAAK